MKVKEKKNNCPICSSSVIAAFRAIIKENQWILEEGNSTYFIAKLQTILDSMFDEPIAPLLKSEIKRLKLSLGLSLKLSPLRS